MPASRAARTHAAACSSSTWPPWVSQLPYEISLTNMPLRPRCRNSMPATIRDAITGLASEHVHEGGDAAVRVGAARALLRVEQGRELAGCGRRRFVDRD